MAAEDALFEAPGAVGAFLQHFDIVIGFKHEHIGAADSFQHQFCGMAEVGQKADIAAGGLDQETNGVLGVMRHAERLDMHLPNIEARAGAEEAAFEFYPELKLNGFTGGTVTINGHVQFLSHGTEGLNMVRVFVGDEDPGKVFGHPADRGQPLPNLPQAESGIDEQPRFSGFQVGAIASGTAAKNRQAYGHGLR